MQEDERPGYQPGYKNIEPQEWRTAENSAAFLIPHLQELAKQKPNLRLLDVGAGSGTITISFAKYMPSGQITASDLSEDVLAMAKEHAQSQGVDLTTQRANVYELAKTFGECSFDVVYTSMMLLHLEDPVAAIAQMVAVCKPGGIVAIRESDIRMWSFFPETFGLKKWHEAVIATHPHSTDAGSMLLHWALAVGVPRERMTWTMSTWTWSTPKEKLMWSASTVERLTNGSWKKLFIEKGHCTEEMIDIMSRAWQDWAREADSVNVTLHGELIIRK